MELDLPEPVLVNILATFCNIPSYIYENDPEEMIYAFIEWYTANHAIENVPRSVNKNEGYVERVVPSLTASQFKNHFRMLPSTFEYVLEEIATQLQRSVSGNEMISPEKQFLIALWRISTPDSYKSIHIRFEVGKATAVRAVRRVTQALCSLTSKFIQWPEGKRIEDIVQGFSQAGGFPKTIGAIDSMYINIPAPKDNPEVYVNWKGQHSIQAQVICDNTCLFTHVYVGSVGSIHDARVFKLSAVQDFTSSSTKFPDDSHLIGDTAYPLLKQLMVPYTDNDLTRHQENYNSCLSSSHVAVERAIGLLKGRWRSLLHYLGCIEHIPYYFLACCVLHNICLMRKDELETIVFDNVEAVHPGPKMEVLEHRDEAETKRDLICAILNMKDE